MKAITLTSLASLLLALGAATAEAEPYSADVRADYKTESQNTVMTAPISGPFIGGSYALGSPELVLHPRVWASLGAMFGLESTGWSSELGGTLTYYGTDRHDGFGATLDLGVSLLNLDQQHDGEHLVAGALIAEPGVIFTKDRWSFVLGVRGKDVVYERMSREDGTEKTSQTSKTETGIKLSLRVAF